MSVEEATFVRRVDPDEALEEIVNEAKAMTWVHEAEHALLELSTGELILARGGRDGIRFRLQGEGDKQTIHLDVTGKDVQVVRIHWHTHPAVTGPSDGDLEAMAVLKQNESWIYELGGDPHGTRIRPKPGTARE